jgi:ribose transport system substrate-binding protein
MRTKRGGALLTLALACTVAMVAAANPSAKPSAVPSWCGPKKIKLGFTDGFGGNSWRLVTTASARDEAQKCPSVSSIDYADGQGNTQKAISDIQGMVAKGVDALVVFPDAGKAMLPALRSAYKAGVVTVPYRVDPGGKAGVDYNVWVDTPFTQAGENWGRWILRVLPKGGNVLMLSGPKGNSQGVEENKGLHKILDPTNKYKFIGEQPFEVTNWDPALTQKVLSAAIAKNPKIDVIVSDFGPSLVAKNPTFKLYTVSTQNDHARLAIDWAVALATGGKKPATTHFPSLVFEDSTTGKPNPVECQSKLPGDIYLSAQLPAATQAKLVKG